ncbi:TIGR02444 family protein [Pseudoalteromonas sp. MMG012]|uniref:TIGR02444 family protein n=1 Tax=Pseudoalteromonas sp. MMG012 TaxID=2822686 RepID=UPI001B3A46DB|nr:TIGR02444 family protein [Pseudoalteromonas sp. MMG012]MBQ4850665.1 TIGR02444 family protein [Pseudoalteromonas sp. MMG012]
MNALSAALFWQFSCASYALPNIKELLLSLQDKHNKNINLCLLLLYLEQQKIQLTPIQVKALADLCSDIDAQTLLQHRQLRKHIKASYQRHPAYQSLRKQLLTSELALEKFQQQLLIEHLESDTLNHNNVSNNLTFYLDEHHALALKQCFFATKT